MSTSDRAEILEAVAAMVRDVVGEAWVADAQITAATSFVHDLELESIELVALAEKVQERYGAVVDFPAWLSTMELDRILALTVGELVDHIAQCQSKTTAG